MIYKGVTLSLVKRQMSEVILKVKWKRIDITHQVIFSILQHGLH